MLREALHATRGANRVIGDRLLAQGAELEAAYPQLFVSDDEIRARRRVAVDGNRKEPESKRTSITRAAAYRAWNEYLPRTYSQLKPLIAHLKGAE